MSAELVVGIVVGTVYGIPMVVFGVHQVWKRARTWWRVHHDQSSLPAAVMAPPVQEECAPLVPTSSIAQGAPPFVVLSESIRDAVVASAPGRVVVAPSPTLPLLSLPSASPDRPQRRPSRSTSASLSGSASIYYSTCWSPRSATSLDESFSIGPAATEERKRSATTHDKQ